MISYNNLIKLGFTAADRVKEDEFSYQVFTLKHKDSYIEVTTEFDYKGVPERQLLDYRLKNLEPLRCTTKKIENLKTLMQCK